MGKGGKIAREAMTLCAPLVERLERGLVLADCDFVQEERRQVLRLVIDAERAVDLDDCSAVSDVVNPVLDDSFSWTGPYFLEVCSLGYERALPDRASIMRHRDEWLEFNLYQARDGVKTILGRIQALDNEGLSIELRPPEAVQKGRRVSAKKLAQAAHEMRLEWGEIAKIKRHLDF